MNQDVANYINAYAEYVNLLSNGQSLSIRADELMDVMNCCYNDLSSEQRIIAARYIGCEIDVEGDLGGQI